MNAIKNVIEAMQRAGERDEDVAKTAFTMIELLNFRTYQEFEAQKAFKNK